MLSNPLLQIHCILLNALAYSCQQQVGKSKFRRIRSHSRFRPIKNSINFFVPLTVFQPSLKRNLANFFSTECFSVSPENHLILDLSELEPTPKPGPESPPVTTEPGKTAVHVSVAKTTS